MSFNITTVHYPRTLMFGETYDFSKITVETDTEGLTIDKIDAKWLTHQPPFNEMGYYPIRITATASNGETATETVQVFVFKKPHDGYRKFMIYDYKDKTYLMSYDCTDNPEHHKFYCSDAAIRLRDVTNLNGYLGQQGYVFDSSTKTWTYDKTLCGYSGYSLNNIVNITEILYSNSDVYAKDQKTLIYVADPMKILPAWDKNTEFGLKTTYSDVLSYDETIEAYYIISAYAGGTLAYYAMCFRNLKVNSQGVANFQITPQERSYNLFKYEGENTEHCRLRLTSSGTWQKSVDWRKNATIYDLSDYRDNNLGYVTFMNSLQEVYNIEFTIHDVNGDFGRPVLHSGISQEQEEVVKHARYRMKEKDGSYSVLHFETNRDMVIGLNEKLSEIDTLIENQYNKAQTLALFDEVDEEIQAMEQVAEGLSQRLETAEPVINDLQTALEQQVSHAQTAEAHLQEQLNGIDFDIDVINHPESGILAQSKDYTDELVKGLADGAIKDLEGALSGNVSDLTNRIETLTQTVASNKAEAEVKTSKLDTDLTVVETRIETVEGGIVELGEEDTRLATEIDNLKGHLSNKNSNTLVFATYEEFEQAMGSLTPKIGDLVHVLGQKRSYIWTQNNEFVVLDTITSEADLTDYIKRSELELAVQDVETLLTNEVERATLAEQTLNQQIGDLADVVDTHSIRIEGLENETQTHEIEIDGLQESRYTQADIDRLINEEIERQMPHLGDDEPTKVGLKYCHIWLDTSLE